MGASGARMAKRSGHAESGGHDARRERPATGHGQPHAGATAAGGTEAPAAVSSELLQPQHVDWFDPDRHPLVGESWLLEVVENAAGHVGGHDGLEPHERPASAL